MNTRPAHVSVARKDVLTAQPPADIVETETGFRIAVDMPGVDKDSIELRLEKRTLEVRGAFRPLAPLDSIERPFRELCFKRVFHLSEAVNKDAIDVRVEQGVLVIDLPRASTTNEAVSSTATTEKNESA